MSKKKLEKGKLYKGYFLLGDLEESELLSLEKIVRMDKIESLKKIINDSAELSGRTHVDTTLLDPQTIPVAMSWLNKRFFIGDKPGLGKTVISTASYALYRKKMIEAGLPVGKMLLVTDNNHCLGMSKEMREKFGVNLLPLIDGTDKIERTLKKIDFRNDDSFDGVVTSWGSVKSNGFLYFYLEHSDLFNFAVLDETSKLKNNDSQVYQVVDDIVNKYNGGIERVMFLNGSSFEKSIYDLYNQFAILSPRMFPNKKFIDDNYVIKGGKSWFETSINFVNGVPERSVNQRRTGMIVDYKNQEDLKKRIRHHYMARSKSDYSDVLPQYNFRLYVTKLSKEQEKMMDSDDVIVNSSLLNSPTTRDKKAKFNETTVPKLGMILEHFEQVFEDRPIIYVYNTDAQYKIKEALTERGYSAEILNGELDSTAKQDLIEKFNNKKIDTLIFNIERAINIPTSDRIIFYDIPTMPQRTYQIKGRIDRNNYTQPKFYDFFVYLDSPEMLNIIELAYFREKHASAFTGQEEDLYKQLIEQLYNHYEKEQLEKIGEFMNNNSDSHLDEIFGNVKDIFKMSSNTDSDLESLFN